jgi:hypothetical protein
LKEILPCTLALHYFYVYHFFGETIIQTNGNNKSLHKSKIEQHKKLYDYMVK